MKQRKELILFICFIVVIVVCLPAIGLSKNAIPSDRQSTLSTHMNTEMLNNKAQFLDAREEIKFIGGLVKDFFSDESLRFFDIGCGNNEFLNRLLNAFPEGNRSGVNIELACGVDIEDAGMANHTTDNRFLFLNENVMRVASFVEKLSSGEKDFQQDGLGLKAAECLDTIKKKFNIITINGDMVHLLEKLPSVVHALGRERCIVIIRPYMPNWSYNKSLNILNYCKELETRGFALEIFGDANHAGKDLDVLSSELYKKFPTNFHNRFIRGYPSTRWGTDSFFIVLTREKKSHPDNQDMPANVMSAWSILFYQAA